MEEGLGPLLESLARVAGLLWQKGWAERSAGNISVCLGEITIPEDQKPIKEGNLPKPLPEVAGCSFLITAAGSRMRDIADDPTRGVGIVRVSRDGSAYSVPWCGSEGFSPSSEMFSHMGIHAIRSSGGKPCGAVLHAHPDELIALSLREELQEEGALNTLLMSVHPEAAIVIPEGVGFVPYMKPGSEELSAATLSAFREHSVVIWGNHGAISTGKDLDEAFDLMDVLNKLARIYLLTEGNYKGWD